MAKLSNVKTLDMVNGEVTKIEHNGTTYVKTDDKVKVGDIFKLMPGHLVIEGEDYAYYSTQAGSGSTVLVDTKYLGSASAVQSYGEGVAFRKTSEASASVSDRVTALESRVSNLEAKKPVQLETITHEGVEYKRVDREAREGDVVVFGKSDNPEWLIVGGKPYEVVGKSSAGRAAFIGEDGDDYHVYNDMFANRTPSNVKVYEPVVAKPAPLQVGDYAKVVKVADPMCGFNVGDIGEILDTKTHGIHPIAIKSENGIVGYGSEGLHLVRATDEEVAEAKRQAAEKAVADKWAEIGRKPNEFKVGDAVQYKKAFTTVSYVGPKYIRIKQSSNVENNIAVNPANLTLVFPVESKFGGDSE